MDARTEANRQIAAYALWLEERGLRTPSFRETVSPAGPQAQDIEQPGETARTDLLFVGDRLFTGDERALLARIIAALALAPEAAPILEDATPTVLREAIERLRPSAVILLGIGAVRDAIEPKASFRQLAGRLFRCPSIYAETALFVTYHPRDLLRFPGNKRQTWEDLQRAAAFVRSQTCAQ